MTRLTEQRSTMAEQWSSSNELTIDDNFRNFVEEELLPGIGMDPARFWAGLEGIVDELSPENRRLLETRDELQRQIDNWHLERRDEAWDAEAYKDFLRRIGYLEKSGDPFEITTHHVDPEVAETAGPQLVVPVSNARFALNAANARWGSLYDALYGSDVIDERDGREKGDAYNPGRGRAVIDFGTSFLDRAVPLRDARHGDVERYEARTIWRRAECIAVLKDGRETKLRDAWQFAGYRGRDPVTTMLFKNNGLHIELRIDRSSPVGRDAPGGVSDIHLESALTTIQDCEDSVAAVDAEDKTNVYRNWLGLMQGTLQASFEKDGRTLERKLNEDRRYVSIDGGDLILPGRSVMLVRNVGHLMTNDMILDAEGKEIFEGILDAVLTVACALVDVRCDNEKSNSRTGSIYIVKPKMHGSAEARFADKLFSRVESMFGLIPNTIKIGVMDEERRTTVNLQECIRAVKSRIVFINTGFLDRTGDEIHTSMRAGAMLPKEQIKSQPWIQAYENRNVDIGLRCGFVGRAQIGKGMWPMPDEMKRMVETKYVHPESGANCAWVPSPTAATLHAIHYHDCNVKETQQSLRDREIASLDDILQPPFLDEIDLSPEQIQSELDNNAQGILGYVVRWVDHGVGCSKVPDINDTGLMEDRATLRISSQHICNWMLHGICTGEQVQQTFARMAAVVDAQNADDPLYRPMGPEYGDSFAFNAALDLVFKGMSQPNGYTEPLLHTWRRKAKKVVQ